MRRRVVLALALALALAGAVPCTAQSPHPWFIGPVAAWTAFSAAASTDAPSPDETSIIGIGSGDRWGLTLGRTIGRLELALTATTGGHALEAGDDEIRVGVAPAFTLRTVAITVAYPVLRFSAGPSLRVFGGPALAIWSGDVVAETQVRFGGTAGIGLVAPLTDWLSLDAHASLGIVGSPITDADLATLESDYDRGTGWSRELGLGLRFGF